MARNSSESLESGRRYLLSPLLSQTQPANRCVTNHASLPGGSKVQPLNTAWCASHYTLVLRSLGDAGQRTFLSASSIASGLLIVKYLITVIFKMTRLLRPYLQYFMVLAIFLSQSLDKEYAFDKLGV